MIKMVESSLGFFKSSSPAGPSRSPSSLHKNLNPPLVLPFLRRLRLEETHPRVTVEDESVHLLCSFLVSPSPTVPLGKQIVGKAVWTPFGCRVVEAIESLGVAALPAPASAMCFPSPHAGLALASWLMRGSL